MARTDSPAATTQAGSGRPPVHRTLAWLFSLAAATAAGAPLDLAALWDFNRPDLSEQRFRQALETAAGDDVLILQTQIARSLGLRQRFDEARRLLHGIEPGLAAAGAEARVRFALEMGRTHASATHPAALASPDADAQARHWFNSALATARAARLDGLAIDALHMLAFVDRAPADQLRWAQQALAVVDASPQAAAKRWEPSIRNNLGLALHRLGRHDEALAQFQQAVLLRERGGNAEATRTARWMVAWTLRTLGRLDEALALQLRLAHEGDAAGQPDPEVFEELATLYHALGDEARARHYADRQAAARP